VSRQDDLDVRARKNDAVSRLHNLHRSDLCVSTTSC
jgi:hypothetical protein